jgi:hypothetical protein
MIITTKTTDLMTRRPRSINEKLLFQGACLRFADPQRNDPIVKIFFLIALLFEDIDNTDRHIALPISLHFSLSNAPETFNEQSPTAKRYHIRLAFFFTHKLTLRLLVLPFRFRTNQNHQP